MLFHSVEFAFLFIFVFLVHWFILAQQVNIRNAFLLVISYVFYGCWDWRFLFILFCVSFSGYWIGLRIEASKKQRKKWLITGLTINLGTLIYFKYFNFFVTSFLDLFPFLHSPSCLITTIVPIGISFQVFITISYLFDVYWHKIEAERNLINSLLTVGFFPIVLAGPIQRPLLSLPQYKKKSFFQYEQALDGLRQLLWGLFAKVVIADNIGQYINPIFGNSSYYPCNTLLFGIFLYSIQIYADFSGYSDMSIGLAKLLGINLVRNFRFPYFCISIADFWRRWHISMTTWFRDYLFLPLSYSLSRKIPGMKIWRIPTDIFIYIIGSLVTWSLTGLWHGDNITFVCWGLIHGTALIAFQILQKPRRKFLRSLKLKYLKSIFSIIDRIAALSIVMFAWIFFRSSSMENAMKYLKGIFNDPFSLTLSLQVFPKEMLVFIPFFFCMEWIQRDRTHGLEYIEQKLGKAWRWLIYYILIIAIIYFGAELDTSFLYFQF
ncbi:MBOAT family protein [bacterium]|nr:MBOAT family protein [bacterium]